MMPTIYDHFAILKPDLLVDTLAVSPSIYQQLDEWYDGFRGHTLISAYHFTEDWQTWEKHPAGDEMVILLSGKAQFLLRGKTGDESIMLEEPGAYLIVPKDTWHTARISQPASVLFVTSGEGTQNDATPAD